MLEINPPTLQSLHHALVDLSSEIIFIIVIISSFPLIISLELLSSLPTRLIYLNFLVEIPSSVLKYVGCYTYPFSLKYYLVKFLSLV